MAKIALRAYNREIESMVDGGRIDEAIAHCRYILQVFPKHVDTYRLLGKAFLESQRYGDAADILQRVLSSVPDDFVSHVGMSIIREDEGNLDQAIWHMERAFEVQPANYAIKEELRRLYGRRDGIEPPKVRLTRGALARMYFKGDLNQQAAAELNAALAENPDRVDLQVLLARVYARSGQRIEAVETSSALLRKLPYCLEANCILAETLAANERSDEAQAYRQKITALDPYLAHLSPTANTPEKVPEQAVLLERMVWVPGQEAGQPAWAASLGVSAADLAPENEALPDWISTAPTEPTERAAEAAGPQAEEAPAGPEEESQIPAWLSAAGWSAAAEAVTQPPVEGEPSPAPEPGDLAAAEIPEWMRAMAPGLENPEEAAAGGPVSEGEESTTPAWLQTGPEGEIDFGARAFEIETGAPDWLESGGEAEAPAEGEQVPDWLSGLAAEAPPPGSTPEPDSAAESLPEWLNEPVSADEVAGPVPDLVRSELPDWLAEAGPAEQAEKMEASAFEPGSDQEWVPEISAPESAETAPAAEQGDLPDWLQGLAPEEQAPTAEPVPAVEEAPAPPEGLEQPPVTILGLEEDAAAFAWLENLAAKQGAEEALLLSPEERRETPPEWVQEAGFAAQPEAPEVETPEPEPGFPAEIEEPAETGTAVSEPALKEAPEPAAASEAPGAPAEALPDWLEETTPFQTAPEALVEPEEAGQVPEWPDWMRETIPSRETLETAAIFHPTVPSEAEEMTAASEVAEPASLDTSQPTGLEAPSKGEVPEEGPVSGLEQLELAEAAPIEGDTKPVWVKAPEEAPPVEAAAPVEAIPGEEPETIQLEPEPAAGGLEAGEVESPQESEAGTPPAVPGMDIPVSEMELPSEAGLFPAQPGEQAMPASPEPEGQTLTGSEDIDAAFAWLESLAVKQGAEEALLLAPEERAAEPPAWVSEPAEAQPVEPAGPEAEPDYGRAAVFDQPVANPPVEEQEAPAGVESTGFESQEQIEAPAAPEIPVMEAAPQAEALPEEPAPAEEPIVEPTRFEPQEQIEAPDAAEIPVMEAAPQAEARPEEPAPAEEPVTGPTGFEPQAQIEPPAGPLSEEAVEMEAGEEIPSLPDWLAEISGGEAEGEAEPWAALETPAPAGPAQPAIPAEQLDLNQASLVELERLPDMGFILAQRIIMHRETTGPFKNLEDLLQIPGITPAYLDDLRAFVRVAVEPPAETGSRRVEPGQAPVELLKARQALAEGSLSQALEQYAGLIQSRLVLDEIIHDLQDALYHYPTDPNLWEHLGDAYMRADKLQEALDAYSRGIELLR